MRNHEPVHAEARLREDLVDFLVARLTEDLALIWDRDAAGVGHPSRPGMAAQVAVLDELLSGLGSGVLPRRRELRILLYGYGAHPDYEPHWTRLLMDGPG